MNLQNSVPPRLSSDGHCIEFAMNVAGRSVKGQITLAALVQHFWLRPGADASSALNTFDSGLIRILAVAQRLALKRGASEVHLDVADF